MNNHETHKSKILRSLRAGPKTTDFLNFDLRISGYRSRIDELRKDGFDIQAEKIGKSRWLYTLHEKQERLPF